MNDEVLTLLTDRFSELEMKTPIEEIYARSRRHRKMRRDGSRGDPQDGSGAVGIEIE